MDNDNIIYTVTNDYTQHKPYQVCVYGEALVGFDTLKQATKVADFMNKYPPKSDCPFYHFKDDQDEFLFNPHPPLRVGLKNMVTDMVLDRGVSMSEAMVCARQERLEELRAENGGTSNGGSHA